MKANTENNTERHTKWVETSGRPVARSRGVQRCVAACLQLTPQPVLLLTTPLQKHRSSCWQTRCRSQQSRKRIWDSAALLACRIFSSSSEESGRGPGRLPGRCQCKAALPGRGTGPPPPAAAEGGKAWGGRRAASPAAHRSSTQARTEGLIRWKGGYRTRPWAGMGERRLRRAVRPASGPRLYPEAAARFEPLCPEGPTSPSSSVAPPLSSHVRS